MFDLEQSITEWRKQMLAAGIKTPVPLEELEIHLREEIERQMKSGLNEQKAFEISAQQIGQPKMLDSEFKKSERTFMKKTLIVLAGILGVMVGAAFILPAAAWYRDHGAMPAAQMGFLALGIAIAIGGLSTAIYGFKKRKA
jgi:hypothetical protein